MFDIREGGNIYLTQREKGIVSTKVLHHVKVWPPASASELLQLSPSSAASSILSPAQPHSSYQEQFLHLATKLSLYTSFLANLDLISQKFLVGE